MHRVIFNRALGVWQAVAKFAKGSGKLGGSVKRNAGRFAVVVAMAAVTGGLGAGEAQAQSAPVNNQLPQGGKVTAGQAQINQAGNVMNIDQSSQKAIINWNEFNVGQDATVNFNQPNASAATLNRVLNSSPSQIFGQIVAPGQVILINPNGAYFAPSASVDVGGLIATTHELADKDFLDGNYQFKRNGATGKIINDGALKAKLDGYIALMAPEVKNQGVIIAERGTVVLASGEHIQLDFGTGNKLKGITVTEQDFDAQIENRHAIIAEGGLVILSARATAELRASVIKNSGQIIASAGANTVTQKGGRIILEGNTIEVTAGSELIATGPKGGGEILIGGDWQGGTNALRRVLKTPDAMHQATTVTVEQKTKIDASATDNGDGGTVVVWSDVTKQNSVTTAQGEILARGGEVGGDGGQIETSGYRLEIAGARVEAGAENGVGGLWLLDPSDSTINQAVADTYVTSLNAGTNVLKEVTGSITVDNGVSILKTSGGDASLTLKATEEIQLGQGISIISSVGSLDVVFWADSDQNDNGSIRLNGIRSNHIDIQTNGGDVVFGGGSDPYSIAVSGSSSAINLEYADLDAAGGDLLLRGAVMYDPYLMSTSAAVTIYESSLETTAAGQIFITATNGPAQFINSTLPTKDRTLSTVDGDVTVRATGVSSSDYGIQLDASDISVTGSGNITVESDGLLQLPFNTQSVYGSASHTGNIVLKAPRIEASSTNGSLLAQTAGNVSILPYDTSFSATQSLGFLYVDADVQNLVIGAQSNMSTVQVVRALDVAGDMTIGASTITLSVDLSAAGTLTLHGSVNLTGAVQLTANGLDADAINLNANGLTVNETGVGLIDGLINGTGGLTKTGAGQLTTSSANTYSGGTTVSVGTLKAGVSTTGEVTNGPFGTGTVTVADGATLDLAGFDIVNAMTLSGTGFSGNGALHNSSASAASASGDIELVADTTVNAIGSISLGKISSSYALNLQNIGLVTLLDDVGSSSARLFSLSASGSVKLHGDIWTSGVQLYGADLGLASLGISLDALDSDVSIVGDVLGVGAD